MDLSEFLLARIAEDEAAARAVNAWAEAPRRRSLPWKQTPDDGRVLAWGLTCVGAGTTPVVAEHMARWDPTRVLAECEAKRRIVESARHTLFDDPLRRTDFWRGARDVAEADLCFLALPYADHADFRAEWKVLADA